MAMLLKADGSSLSIPYPEGLEAKQALVGGLIEVISLRNGLSLIVNEEGLIHGLPVNREASLLYGHTVVGDALLFDRADTKLFRGE